MKKNSSVQGHGTLLAVVAASLLMLATLPARADNELSPAMDHAHHAHHGAGQKSMAHSGPVPALPGQDAFGAIQEIVHLLEADPGTDWSKVDLEALRQHLIDMNEVTLHAAATAKPIDGGLELSITGAGRTLQAIQRMIPAHAQELDRINGWKASAQVVPAGVVLRVTAGDPKEVTHIRGLGFAGLLVSGSHHRPHHLAMAKGEWAHRH
jgi:hypothetical protein